MNRKRKKAAIFGYSGKGNIGNEAIIKGIMNSLRLRIKDLEFILLTDNPDHVKDLYPKVKKEKFAFSISQKRIFLNPWRLIRVLKESDYIIFNAGALHDKYGDASWPYPSGFSMYVFFYVTLLLLGSLFGCKAIFYANMAGPYEAWFSKHWIRFVFNRIDLVTVRDHKSKERLKSLGVKKDIHVTACPAFLTPTAEESIAERLFKENNIPMKGRPLIGVSLQAWLTRYRIYNKIYPVNLHSQFAKAFDTIIEKFNAHIVFINMVVDVPHYRGDRWVAQEVADLMKNKDHISILKGTYSIEKTASFISCMDIIIGMRLHSLVLAATQFVPSIAVAPYDEVIYMFEQFQDAKYLIKMPDFKAANNVIEIVGDLLENKNSVMETLRSKVYNLRKLADKNADLVCLLA